MKKWLMKICALALLKADVNGDGFIEAKLSVNTSTKEVKIKLEDKEITL